MKVYCRGDTLCVTDVQQLSSRPPQFVREQIKLSLPARLRGVEIDLARLSRIDSDGLGVLITVFQTAREKTPGVPVRLLNVRPRVQQILDLTRMHRLFEMQAPQSLEHAA